MSGILIECRETTPEAPRNVQKSVSSSSTELKCIALSDASWTIKWLRKLAGALCLEESLTVVFQDSYE